MQNIFKDCYGCTERARGCHSTCDRYKRNYEKNQERLKKIARMRNEQNIIVGYDADRVAKNKRKKG